MGQERDSKVPSLGEAVRAGAEAAARGDAPKAEAGAPPPEEAKERKAPPPQAPRLPPEEERALVERLKKRDAGALSPLVVRYGEELYARVILPCLGAPEEARDVLKEVFLTAFDRIETFSWRDGGLYPWLRRIAHNKAIDRHRARAREKRFQSGYTEFLEAAEPPPDTEAMLLSAEERARNLTRLREALTTLAPRYRQAIELRILEERPREECAKRMEITVGNFDVVLFRALASFRKAFFAKEGSE
jgi:RNA polymerase sigma factor (sigma-70 family)